MNTIRPPASAGAQLGAVLALLGAVLALGITGCTLIQGRTQRTVTISLPRPEPSALVVVLFRDSATAVRTEFRTMVAATARAGEHLIVIDADSGRELGSFLAPADPTMAAPPPPAPLPQNPTSFQRAKHTKAVAAYAHIVRSDLAGLRARERQLLASWAATVLMKVTSGNGVGLDSRARSLATALDAAVADFSSLRQSGVVLGSRKVLAILGFDGQRADSAPALSASLQQTSVVVTRFPAKPGAQRAWRSGLMWQGASHVVLLTRAASDELATVVARDFAGTAAQRVLAQA